MDVGIVGGGIAGLSLASGLHRVGVPCRVLEARPTAELGGGAFLALAPNGRKAVTGHRATVRDLTLPLFLRMGAASAQRHHAYRLPPLPGSPVPR